MLFLPSYVSTVRTEREWRDSSENDSTNAPLESSEMPGWGSLEYAVTWPPTFKRNCQEYIQRNKD